MSLLLRSASPRSSRQCASVAAKNTLHTSSITTVGVHSHICQKELKRRGTSEKKGRETSLVCACCSASLHVPYVGLGTTKRGPTHRRQSNKKNRQQHRQQRLTIRLLFSSTFTSQHIILALYS